MGKLLAPRKSEQARMVGWSTDHPTDSEDFEYEETPFGLLLGTPDQWFETDYELEELYRGDQ